MWAPHLCRVAAQHQATPKCPRPPAPRTARPAHPRAPCGEHTTPGADTGPTDSLPAEHAPPRSRVPALALCPPHSPQPPPRETLTGTLTQLQRTHRAPCCPSHSMTPWPASLWAVTCPQGGWRGQGLPQAQPRVAAACRPWQESPEAAWARGLPTLARPSRCRQVVQGGLQRGLGPQCLPTRWHHRPRCQDSLREQRPRLGSQMRGMWFSTGLALGPQGTQTAGLGWAGPASSRPRSAGWRLRRTGCRASGGLRGCQRGTMRGGQCGQRPSTGPGLGLQCQGAEWGL